MPCFKSPVLCHLRERPPPVQLHSLRPAVEAFMPSLHQLPMRAPSGLAIIMSFLLPFIMYIACGITSTVTNVVTRLLRLPYAYGSSEPRERRKKISGSSDGPFIIDLSQVCLNSVA
ncbi:hypothetical protein ACTXT7_001043 [Hymenolepis weldensis]